jgi:hypothetical protein
MICSFENEHFTGRETANIQVDKGLSFAPPWHYTASSAISMSFTFVLFAESIDVAVSRASLIGVGNKVFFCVRSYRKAIYIVFIEILHCRPNHIPSSKWWKTGRKTPFPFKTYNRKIE